MSDLMIGWTTVENREQAVKLAQDILAEKLASCVQMDTAVESVYVWEGKITHAQEVRLAIKFSSSKSEALKNWIEANHPYSNPQWLAVTANDSLEKYRKWVIQSSR